jgi:site-specific recombinase XerD
MDKQLVHQAYPMQREPGELITVSPSVKRYVRQSRADNTVRTYRAAWREFTNFANQRGESALPASETTVAEYLAALADSGAKVSTISVKLAAIAWAHRLEKVTDPTVFELVKGTMAGIRRELGIAANKKEPATLAEIQAMVATLPGTAKGKRDKALLLVGFVGAFRRSELVALDVADIRFNGTLTISIRKSKTDQEGKGAIKVIRQADDGSICPVAALRDWLDVADIKSGPVFRRMDRHGNVHQRRLTAQSVALVVKQAARDAGLDWRAFSGHSLRSGFVTEARCKGVSNADIMDQTLHESDKMIREYDHSKEGAIRAVDAVLGNEHG